MGREGDCILLFIVLLYHRISLFCKEGVQTENMQCAQSHLFYYEVFTVNDLSTFKRMRAWGSGGKHRVIAFAFPWKVTNRNAEPASSMHVELLTSILQCYGVDLWIDFFPQQANSHVVVSGTRKIKEPPTDPSYCLALSSSISSVPQSARYICTSCLLGVWQTPVPCTCLLMHELCMFESK